MPYSKILPLCDLLEIDFGDDAEQIRDKYKNFSAGYEEKSKENRDLSISLIGRVKGGKSSMVNALLFEGEQRLPEAAIPQTASLTYIRYAPKSYAVIHFYSQEDWDGFVAQKDNADRKKNEFRARFAAEEEDKAQKKMRRGERYVKKTLTPQMLSTMAGVLESEFSAEEIISNVERNNLEPRSLIEQKTMIIEDSVEEPLDSKLETYIGANGKYTPMVHHVELFINDEMMKGYEIVDTPGTNDPIVSRGKMTMDSLSKTSVVFALSPCRSFFDESDLQLLSMLPQNGVSCLTLVASQYDQALKADSYRMPKDLPNEKQVMWLMNFVQSEITKSFNSRVKNAMVNAENNGNTADLEILKKLADIKPIFCAAKLYTLAKHWGKWNANEQEIFDSIRVWCKWNSESDDVIKEDLLDFSGISNMQDILKDVRAQKAEILRKDLQELEEGNRQTVGEIVKNLKEKLENRISVLENSDIVKLREDSSRQKEKLNGGRSLLNSSIDEAIEGLNQAFLELKNEVSGLRDHYNQLSISTKTSTETYMKKHYRTGLIGKIKNFFFGPEEIEQTRVIRTQTTDTVDAIRMVESFANQASLKLQQAVSESVRDTRKRLRNNLSDALETIFADDDSDYMNMKLQLEESLSKVKIDNGNFTLSSVDHISSKFSGTVQNEKIEALKKAQMDSLRSVSADLERKVTETTSVIQKQAQQVKVTFVDNFIKDLMLNVEKICEDLKNKEETLKRLYHIQQEVTKI